MPVMYPYTYSYTMSAPRGGAGARTPPRTPPRTSSLPHAPASQARWPPDPPLVAITDPETLHSYRIPSGQSYRDSVRVRGPGTGASPPLRPPPQYGTDTPRARTSPPPWTPGGDSPPLASGYVTSDRWYPRPDRSPEGPAPPAPSSPREARLDYLQGSVNAVLSSPRMGP